MRIESGPISTSSPIAPLLSARNVQPGPASAGREGFVEISATGRVFLSARQALAGLPAVRDEQVQQFHTLLASGCYRPDGEACASAMLSNQEVVRL